MSFWFTNYRGYDWSPVKGYNDFFGDKHIRRIREWFMLQKTRSPGNEESTGTWRRYELQGAVQYVIVDRFSWLDAQRIGSTITPVLRLSIRIARPINRREDAITISQAEAGRKLERPFFTNTIKIEFPEDYPSKPPRFYVDDERYYSLSPRGNHNHHMWAGGVLCIFGPSMEDWKKHRDSIISGLNMAFDWVVWHYNTHRF